MSRIGTVDTLLEEIYFEMSIEETEELLEQYELGLLEAPMGISPEKVAQTKEQFMKVKDALRAAKSSGNDGLIASLTKKLKGLQSKLAWLKQSGREVAHTVSKKGQEVASSVAKRGQEVATKVQGAVAGATPGQKLAVGGAAAAVAAVAAGVVVYKKFFSQAAKACKGKSGADKKNCMNSFKAKGLQAAKAKVMSGMSKCKDDKCKAKLKAKAASFDAKISGLKGAVAEAVISEYVDNYLLEVVEQNSKN
jgi:hypothetical protein